MQFAWHYTSADNLPSIKNSGLMPREGYPLVWFTMNQRWEPLARALEGSARLPTLHRGSEKAVLLGLCETDWRLMTLDRTFGNPLLQDPATSRSWMMLERIARLVGSDPMREWRVAFEEIPFYDLKVQRLQRGVWTDQ